MAFAHHSNRSLYTVAKKLLPALVEHQNNARRNLFFFSFWKLPQPISRAYITYSDNFLKEAQTLPRQMAASMLVRLQAFDKNRSSEGQPLIYMQQALQNFGINVSEEGIPAYREPLTAKEFHFFHHYIEQQGDSETKKST